MPAIRPTGYWATSKRRRIAWALKQVGARRRDAQNRRAVAQWSTRLRRALEQALNGVDWEAWARRRMVAKKIGFTAAHGMDEIPEMDLSDMEDHVRDLYTQSGKSAWHLASRELGGDVALAFPAKEFDKAMGKTFASVTGIADTVQDRMRSMMRDTMARSDTFSDFARNLRREFAEFSAARARVIAVTEYNRAASEATQLLYEKQGIELKVWNTVGDGQVCMVCLDNEAEGAIPIKSEFASGDRTPPAHPSCRCNIGGAE